MLKRAKALEAQGKPVLHLSIGEPDFTAPPMVVEALERSGGNLSRAAELLAITRPTLYDLLDRLEVGGSVRRDRAAES